MSPIAVSAQTTVNSGSATYGSWVVHDLAVSGSTLGKVESYKVDRDLVVWTEINEYLGRRYLRVWNGATVEQLAAMSISDWGQRSDFYDTVTGQYDVSDGVVVWSQRDGRDLDILVYRNNLIEQLTHNDYDDEHPITSNGRIAWTARMNQVYKLMVSDVFGLRSVAEYHVMNYAFSGDNLFWLNIDRRFNQFRVFCSTGNQTNILSEGEVRPLKYNYFLVNDVGGAAWEVLRSDLGNFGMQLVYSSTDGYSSREIFRRQRWFYDLTVADYREDGTLLVNAHDVQTKNLDNTSLIHTSGSWEATVVTKSVASRAQSTINAIVRHQTPDTSSPLIVRYDDGFQDFISLERVRHNLFVADGDVIAAAKNENGGLLLYKDRQVTVILTGGRDVKSIVTRGGTTAWTYENVNGMLKLSVATPAILVGNAAGAKFVTGHLVKADGSQSVYLATPAGDRYVFPAEGQFYSWYDSFDSLETISANELAAMPLTGAVLYPVRTLVKTPSSPKVYTVGSDGQLHWVTDGLVLTTLYGQNWNRQVHDLPESFITAYRFGGAVSDSTGYYSVALIR
ncbi:hypothetical protein KKE28_01750 [Patescibacteria group bacterium]|nr:hypothetical protein [Patescibacteria group bacterium]